MRPLRSSGALDPASVLLPRRILPDPSAFRRRVYDWIQRIPRGRVATYGQIAALAGAPRRARMVGQALGALPPGGSSRGIPWHRVVNAQGRVSIRGGEAGARRKKRPPRLDGIPPETRQQHLLEAEGVRFTQGRLDLARYRWEPAEDFPPPHLGPPVRRSFRDKVIGRDKVTGRDETSGAGLRARPPARRARRDGRTATRRPKSVQSKATSQKPVRGRAR